MSGLTLPKAEGDGGAERAETVRANVNDALIVLGWSVLLGVVAAFTWWKLTPLAEFTRTADNGAMGEQELARQVSADGWFFVVAVVAGLVTGFVLTFWRRRDPVLTVVLVAIGSLLSTWLMVEVGLALGPPDPATILPEAKVGDMVPLQLTVQATGLYATWGAAALAGALVALWGTERR